MGTLYYYNNYYGRKENCGDYLKNDYCVNSQESTSKKSYFGSFIFIALCCCCIICIYKFKSIKQKCNCCRRKNEDESFDEGPNQPYRNHMRVDRQESINEIQRQDTMTARNLMSSRPQ